MAITLAKTIAGVKATLEGITGIDATKVYDYRREVRTEAEAAALWYSTTQNRINAWMVTLAQSEPLKAARGPGFSRTQPGQIVNDIAIQVEGVMGIDDANASERTFRDLTETVQGTFNRIGLLSNVGGLVDGDVAHQEAMQWDMFGYLTLASMYSVHYSRLVCRFTGKVSP